MMARRAESSRFYALPFRTMANEVDPTLNFLLTDYVPLQVER